MKCDVFSPYSFKQETTVIPGECAMLVCPVGTKLFNRADSFFLNMHLNAIQLPGRSLELHVCLVAQCSLDGVHLGRWTQCNQIPFCF